MNTAIIQQYIQFAIDNGWEPFININKLKIEPSLKLSKILEKRLSIKLSYISDNDIIEYFNIGSNNIYKFITSKQFIEAVAIGLLNIKYPNNEFSEGEKELHLDRIINIITIDQAIAIRDNTLEDFIINLGLGTEKN